MRTKLLLQITFLSIVALVLPPSCKAYFQLIDHFPSNRIKMKDWTPPSTRIFVEQANMKFLPVEETVVNGNFSDGLQGWQSLGDITVCKLNTVCIAQTETPTFQQENSLSQLVSPAKTLHFEYQLETAETLPGFDNPAFVVLANNSQIFQVSAEEASNTWTSIDLDLSSITEPTISLEFKAGNTGDQIQQSLVKIRNVSTQTPLVNSQTLFQLQANDSQRVVSYYSYDNQQYITETPFTIQKSGLFGLRYWSVDSYENKEDEENISIAVDNESPPEPEEIEVLYNENHELALRMEYVDDTTKILILGKNSSAENQELTELHIHAIERDFNEASIFVFLEDIPEEYSSFSVELVDQAGNSSNLKEILL